MSRTGGESGRSRRPISVQKMQTARQVSGQASRLASVKISAHLARYICTYTYICLFIYLCVYIDIYLFIETFLSIFI